MTFGINMVPILNGVIAAVGAVITAILALLPTSPFTYVAQFDSGLIGWLNWIFPVASFITHMTAFCLAVGLYYLIRLPLRWIKAVA